MIDLNQRVCVITGAGQGIGFEVARGFAKRGATVIATSLETPNVPGAALNVAYDVADPAAADALMDRVSTQFGRIDCFVANAGIYPRQPWNQITPEQWRQVQAINYDGSWFGAQAAARHMTHQRYGKIVFVTSIEVCFGSGAHIHYTSSKAAILGLTRSMARALGPQGVRVNAIMPGAIRTPTELVQFPDQQGVAKSLDERQCLPGRIEAEHTEPSFAFLCSADSDPITGQILCVDQGLVHY